MFDFHMHTTVSYDGHGTPEEMVAAAKAAGLQEICFTDHLDYELVKPREQTAFRVEAYNAAYDGLKAEGITVRNGVEVGLTPWNVEEVKHDLGLRHYDFVLGSIHFVGEYDPYLPEFWVGKTVEQAEQLYFEEMLKSLQCHDDFDVLGHLTYISKTRSNPWKRIVPIETYRDIIAECLRLVIDKGKGIEVNTSGIRCVGDFLPGEEYLRLYKDLGGRIVTTGSDAHRPQAVGQHIGEATELLKEIFGYVCTFADRKPVFHKL